MRVDRLLHPSSTAPVTDLLNSVGRMAEATDVSTTLHLLPLIDAPAEARALAAASEALGPRIVGRAEGLGKARLLRAGVRLSSAAWQLVAGIAGLILSMALMFGGLLQNGVLSTLRSALRRSKARHPRTGNPSH